MLAELPRKPTFPQHILQRTLSRIEREVEEDVIPVSAGIYSQHKLMQKLQAIPKPMLANYDDVIFYETISPELHPQTRESCPQCGERFGRGKKEATQCNFCGVWNCGECICPRKRYHPRAKESNSPLLPICHISNIKSCKGVTMKPYVEERSLLQELIDKVRDQKNKYQHECQKRESQADFGRNEYQKNTFKIAAMKKQAIELQRAIDRASAQKEDQKMRLGVRQKYLAALMKRKQKMKERQQETRRQRQIEEEQRWRRSQEEKLSPSVVRTLSHAMAYSQSISANKPEDSNEVQEEEQTNQQLEIGDNLTPAIKQTEEQAQEEPTTLPEEGPDTDQPEAHNFQQDESVPPQASINDEEEAQAPEDAPQITEPKMTYAQKRMAEIFERQKPKPQQEQDEQSEEDSLNDETIQRRRTQLMRQSLEEYRKDRKSFQEAEEFQPSSHGGKCNCTIY